MSSFVEHRRVGRARSLWVEHPVDVRGADARAIATAGFANDVDAVNQQAPMYAATANGVEFLRMCDQAMKGNLEVVVVHHPETLGDDYAELVESLNRLADAKLKLAIVPRADRGE